MHPTNFKTYSAPPLRSHQMSSQTVALTLVKPTHPKVPSKWIASLLPDGTVTILAPDGKIITPILKPDDGPPSCCRDNIITVNALVLGNNVPGDQNLINNMLGRILGFSCGSKVESWLEEVNRSLLNELVPPPASQSPGNSPAPSQDDHRSNNAIIDLPANKL